LGGLIAADIEFPGGLGNIGKEKIIVYKDLPINIPDFFNWDLPRGSGFRGYRAEYRTFQKVKLPEFPAQGYKSPK
jgi:hypothetical protein